MRRIGVGVCVLALGLAACSEDGTGPDMVPEARLTFARYSAEYPPETYSASLWAVKGQDRQLVVRYVPHGPDEEGAICMTFRVPPDALLESPTGRRYIAGDSVLITVQVDPARYRFEFQPSGLIFDPAEPALLEVHYAYAAQDVDGDGDVDSGDATLRSRFELWRQERPGDPWTRLGTTRPATDAALAEITSFTGFALAS